MIKDFESSLFSTQNNALNGSWAKGERERWEIVTAGFGEMDLSEEAVPLMREATRTDPADRSKFQQDTIGRCVLDVLSFDAAHYGCPDELEIEVRVHVPPLSDSAEQDRVLRRGIIYFHGGAFILWNASDFDYQASLKAIACDSVVFNVDYRSPPEARSPKGIMDCCAAVRFICDQLLDEYGVDPQRLCLNGESSGGYLAVGAAMHMAKTGDADKLKLLVPDVPAISAHWLDPDDGSGDHWSKNEVMRTSGDGGHLETLKMLCRDLEHQFAIRDPYVFPGEMPDDVLSKLPQCVVLTNEYCFLRKDAELFASRLQSCGKLLDYCVRPGISHYGEIPGVYSDTSSILSKVVKAYL